MHPKVEPAKAQRVHQWLGNAVYLAGAKQFIDLVVDQARDGELEVLPGEASYSFSGNWKLAAENGLDGYHVPTVHANYIMTTARRAKEVAAKPTRNADASQWGVGESGYFAFDNGHGLLYSPYPNYEDRPAYESYARYVREFGELRANWMTKQVRNLLLMPNVFLMDQMSSQIRILRPVSVDHTETITYCIAPKGESADARRTRIRQYEDFFNASGMATPDDLTEFNESQTGCSQYGVVRWSDMSRGQAHEIPGPDDLAAELGIDPGSSGAKASDEGIFIAQHARWAELMKAGPQGGAR